MTNDMVSMTREREAALRPLDEATRVLGRSGWEVYTESRLTSEGLVEALYVARREAAWSDVADPTCPPGAKWYQRVAAATLPELVRRCWDREEKERG